MAPAKGFLEVGTNGTGQVIVNHPDLQPDQNGVGHIVFSADEARNLASLLLRKAEDAEVEFWQLQKRKRGIHD